MACISKRRNRFVVDFRDQTGRRRWESYRTRREAKTALSKRIGEVQRGSYCAPSEVPTLRELAGRWLDGKRIDRRGSTVSVWESQLTLHILPRFGEQKVSQLTVQAVESFRNERRASGLGALMTNKILGTFSSILTYAVRLGYIERNPAVLVERLRRGAQVGDEDDDNGAVRPDSILSLPEIARLLEHATPGLHRTFLTAASLTGARSGELLGLRWQDVDLQGATMTISRSLSWAKMAEQRGGPPAPKFGPPKTSSSRRTIPLSSELILALKRWRLACPLGEPELVFPTTTGTPNHRGHLRRGFKLALVRAGLKSVTLHSLRHSYASGLIERGAVVTLVARLLGHSSPRITLDTYSHWFAESPADEAVADLSAAIFQPSGSKTVAGGDA